jgi:outer membrane protein assembly factor BamE (lipoprotein component of BamABCDE complex)
MRKFATLEDQMRFLLATVLIVALSGCAQVGDPRLREQTIETVAARVTRGQTTRDQIQEIYGTPYRITNLASGRLVYSYVYSQSAATPESFIPVVGRFVAGSNTDTTVLTIFFNTNGIVDDYNMNRSLSQVRPGVPQTSSPARPGAPTQ